jgi:hypothetical protein
VEEGALPPLVVLLRSGTDDGKTNASAAISWLASDAPTLALLVSEGALPPLVALLQSGIEDAKATAASAIADIAQYAPTRSRILEAGALPPLIMLVSPSRAGTEVDAGSNACLALERLAADARLREKAEEHGAAGALAAAKHAPDCEWAEEAGAALRALCPTQDDAERAMGAMHLKSCALSAERELEMAALHAQRDASAECFESLASLAGPVAKGHDVVFGCADGERIGGSRLLLSHASPYYEKLLLGGMVEGTSDVEPDPDFSSAAYRALLGQLHALGHAALPAELDVRLELLRLAAKVRGAPSGGGEGGGADAAARVFERCERALRDSLCAGNCLAVLLHLKPCAAEVPELVDVAHAVAAEHVAVVLKQPEWKEFREEYPKAAMAIMEDIALKLASDNAELASVIAQLTPEAGGSGSTRKRPRAA